MVTHGEDIKLKIDINPSSVFIQEPWSFEVAMLPAVPRCHPEILNDPASRNYFLVSINAHNSLVIMQTFTINDICCCFGSLVDRYTHTH